MGTESIYDISNRANIIHKNTSLNEVVIYEDHRTILNVLFHLKERRKIEESLDIIMFDDHDDFLPVRNKTLRRLLKFLDKPSKEKLNTIVEFDLNSSDDNWVKAGMELGLINNVFLFNSSQSTVYFGEKYETQRFGTKYLYNLGDVWKVLGFHGLFNDPINAQNQPLCEAFGWVMKDKNSKYGFAENRRKFIFDIDLDCFSTQILDKTVALPEEILIPRLIEKSSHLNHYYYCCQDFIQDLIQKSEIATLCFENGCCGGIREAYRIFNVVDRVFFGNELGR